ncbi:MAG: choice-of-anchor tandem repeat GloVer-containing protein [Candidatus Korobacteraceae bacterium]
MACIVFFFCAATVLASPAQSVAFTSMYSFSGSDGANPEMSLVRGPDGNFYGTTANGGANNYGTVFKVTPAGALTTLYSFCSQPNCTDGGYPEAPLVQASDGNFYGTTSWGGVSGAYYGTVFKITPAGALTTMYRFCTQLDCPDGRMPMAGLVQGSDGNFYGTTPVGGAGCYIWGCGTVFQISPAGTFTTLHSFQEYDGDGPMGALVQGSDGNFYGTTTGGGAYYVGNVFTITPSGTLTSLYSFGGAADGANPYAGLVQASDGDFYGTTSGGGTNYDGTVFKITPSGTLTTLHSFNEADGSVPYAPLVQARDENFYGTTHNGGANNSCGTVFEITPAGTLTTLHSFGGADGKLPYGGLVQTPSGFLYGTTSGGGGYNDGTIFRLGLVRSCVTCRP